MTIEQDNFTCYPSLELFFYENREKVFRYWFKKAEEGSLANYAYVRDVINLDIGDYLLGFLCAEGDWDKDNPNDRQYVLLSDIDIHFYESDMEDK